MTRNALTDPKIEIKFLCKKLVCYQNAKFHQPKEEKSFFHFVTSFFPYQGHLRSKVKVPNGSPVMTSYLKLIVTICLSGTVFKISALLIICSLS